MKTDFSTHRDWTAALSGIGAANMAVGSLRQFGVISHLPDPPIAGFDSDKVLLSAPARAFGIPDAPIACVGLLANIPLSRLGGPRRAREHPWIPIVIAAKAVAEVSVASWYLTQMRTRLHTWCAYCLFGFTLTAAIALLSVDEAWSTLRTPRAKAAGILGIALVATLAAGTMHVLDARQRARG